MKEIKVVLILLGLLAGQIAVPLKNVAQDTPQLVLPTEHTASVTSVAFSPDGCYALSGLSDNTLRLWDVSNGRELRSIYGHTGKITSVAFSPNGRYAISGSGDKTIILWEIHTGKNIRSFSGHDGVVTSVAFSLDGFYILSGSNDKTLKLWNMPTGINVRTFSGHTAWVVSVAFSPDGRHALSGSRDKTMKLWDVKTGQEVRSFSGHRWQVSSVAFSPDGRYILSGSYRPLKLWDVATGQPVRTFSGQTGWVSSVAFSPDSRYALSGSGDKSLKLWDVATGQEIKSFSGHTSGITSVAFSPHGRYILSASYDNSLNLWEVSSGELLLTRLHLNQTDWVVITPNGRFDGSPNGIRFPYHAKENKLIPLDALFDRFYTPNLVARVLSSEGFVRNMPDIRKGMEMPPIVRILYPEAGQTLQEQTVEAVLEAVDQGGGLEDLRLYHNSKWIGGYNLGIKNVRGVQRAFTVSLLSGVNTLRVTAFSKDRTEAIPFEVTINAGIAEAKANLYIVAIGINKHKNCKHNLKHSVQDAQAVIASLREMGQGIFHDIKAQTIFDEKAIRLNIKGALKQVEQASRPEDTFIFYYSGRGLTSEGSNKQQADFYLALTDVKQFYGYNELLIEKGISITELRETCQRIKARKQLIVLDTHQPDSVVKKITMREATTEKTIAQLARIAGLTVLASDRSEEIAKELEELGHSLLTYTLLKGLAGEADNSPKDSRVTVNELSSYIQAQIPELSRHYLDESQYPIVYMHSQDFSLVAP